MKMEMVRLVQNNWFPGGKESGSDGREGDEGKGEGVTIFRTDDKQIQAQGHSDYFLDSSNRIHYFAEVDAVDPATGALKPEYLSNKNNTKNKIRALNKAGHGLHLQQENNYYSHSPFASYTTSPKVGLLLRELGWVDPVVPQSMYIFKQASGIRGGGEVTSHQDSTFLHTEPRQTCIGLWLALDDATLTNGCLWVRPGSHHEKLRRRFVRNPKHFGSNLAYDDDDNNNDNTTTGGDRSEPQMIFNTVNINNNVPWEGKLPDNSLPAPECTGLHNAGFIPVPCSAGDLVVFVGTMDHLSLPNTSDGARHTFQLHCVEGEGAGVTWSKTNWLQYPAGSTFMKL
jgi:phytanoyl-CoA hydroxylase